MCLCIVALIAFTIAASVLDFPEPVTPVTSTMPRSASASFVITGGSCSDSTVGTCERNHAHHDHEARPLPQDVDAEAPDAGGAPRAVVVEDLVDPLPDLLVVNQPERDRLRLLRSQRLLRERDEAAIDTCAKDVAGLDVEVGRSAIDSRLDDLFHEWIVRGFSSRRPCPRGSGADRRAGIAPSCRGTARARAPRTVAAIWLPHAA